MRALEKNYMKRGHHSNKHRNKHLNKHTSRLLDQLGPEGRVGENCQVSRPIGIDARRSSTEFIQLQWPKKNAFFNMIIRLNPKSINTMLELLKLQKFHEKQKAG